MLHEVAPNWQFGTVWPNQIPSTPDTLRTSIEFDNRSQNRKNFQNSTTQMEGERILTDNPRGEELYLFLKPKKIRE